MAPTQSMQVLLLTLQDPQDPIRRIIRDAGHPVVVVDSASAAVRAAQRSKPGVIVVDPRTLTPSGRDRLGSFAAEHHIPLIVGWEDHESLMARLEETIVRQEPPGEKSRRLVAGALRVDLGTRVVELGGASLDLTAREFELLSHLARHPGWVYSRQELLEQVWDYEYGDPQIVTVHIANLRKKAKAVAPGYKLIETVPRIGYRLVAEPSTRPDPGVAPSTLGSEQAGAPSGPPSERHRTRVIVGSVVAGVAILVGLGIGLWLGLGGEGGTLVPGDVATNDNPGVSFALWGPETVTQEDEQGDVFWRATWLVHARVGGDPYQQWGTEIMDWSVTLSPPSAPPLGRNETADLLYAGFEKKGDATVATLIFRWDTKDWEHPGPQFEPYPPFIHHTFILTDNPDPQPDHVEAYAMSTPQPDPQGPWGMKFMDTDCGDLQIIFHPEDADGMNTGATSTTQD